MRAECLTALTRLPVESGDEFGLDRFGHGQSLTRRKDLIEPRAKTGYCIGVKSVRYVHRQDGDMWFGYLEDYPDYMTQGATLEELQTNLKDIYDDLTGEHIPGVRKVAELQIA